MENQHYCILAINPGSTSTKVAVYENETLVAEETIRHTVEELDACENVAGQKAVRLRYIANFLRTRGINPNDMDAVVGRGGLLSPIASGTYVVNETMLADLATPKASVHASLLGAVIAKELAGEAGIPAFVVDPVVVDEMEDIARISGWPEIERTSAFHALNAKAMARRYADEHGKRYEDCNLIVAHVGGGTTVSAHQKGRVVDLNNGIEGEGPFSPERSGGLPVAGVVKACFSGKYTQKEMQDIVSRTGGAQAYLGSNDMFAAEKQALQDPQSMAGRVLAAMGYQVAKEIGAQAAALCGQVDAVVLTGGMARCKPVVQEVEKRVGWIAELVVYPGEDELRALAQGALRVLQGKEQAKEYNPKP